MAGVGVLATLFGVSTAWVVSRYHFPGRAVFDWLLVLPAAMPAYIIAYSYTDFLEYAGPVQSGLRAMFGWQTAREYWFPEIRSAVGALLMVEVFARSRRSFQNNGTGQLGVPMMSASPGMAVICFLVCLMPVSIGFFGPIVIVPWFFFLPVMGKGMLGKHTPAPLKVCMLALVNHCIFGVGMAAGFQLAV